MRAVDLLWYRRDDLSRAGHNTDAPRSFHSARANMLLALRRHGLAVRLVIPHVIAEWSARPRWDEDLRPIAVAGEGRLASAFHRLVLAAFFGWWVLARRPRVILTDVDGVLSLLPWAILRKALGRGPRFFLDVRSGPVEDSGSGAGRPVPRRGAGYGLSLRLAERWLDGATFITEGLRDSVAAEYGARFPAAGFWSSGVDPDLFRPDTSVSDCDDRPFTLMYHGEISPNRGIDDLIRAVGLAGRRIDSLRLVVLGANLGRPSAAALLEELEALCASAGAANRVRFLSAIDHRQVPAFINGGDVGVVPWKDRPWWKGQSPLKLLEYLSCGRPVLATDIDATRRVIGDSVCAVYCRPEDPADMAAAIVQVYEERCAAPDRFRERGRAGRALVLAGYTWNAQCEKLIQCLGL